MVVAYVTVFRRLVRVLEDETYITRDWNKDFRRYLKPGLTLLYPQESVIKGKRIPLFDYPSRGSGDEPITVPLRDEKTGSIDLNPQSLVPTFTVRTKDPVEMRVTPEVQFTVILKRIEFVHKQGKNFGRQLVVRLRQAFSVEFGMRHEQTLQGQIGMVESAVLKALQEQEVSDPIGVEFKNIRFDFVRESGRSRDGAHYPDSDGETAPPTSGVAFIEQARLHHLGSLFEQAERTQALLAILEMQTRRDIAEALARSHQLVVVTAQDLGLAGTAVQLDAMRRRSGEGDKGTGASPR